LRVLGVSTVRELAEHKYVRIAQAILALSALEGGSGSSSTKPNLWEPYDSKVRMPNTVQDFKDFLPSAPDLERLEIYRSKEPTPSVEFK
jgi:hypothetical protein